MTTDWEKVTLMETEKERWKGEEAGQKNTRIFIGEHMLWSRREGVSRWGCVKGGREAKCLGLSKKRSLEAKNKSNFDRITGTWARLLPVEVWVESEKVVTACYCPISEETESSSNAHNIIFEYVDVWLVKFATALWLFLFIVLTLWIINSDSRTMFYANKNFPGLCSWWIYRFFPTKAIETMEKVYKYYG